MQAFAVLRTASADDSSGGIPCPDCGAAIENPASSEYRGLGRIEHNWHCRSCGAHFRTGARMAGTVEADPAPISVAAA